MHEAVAGLSPDEAKVLLDRPVALSSWLMERGLQAREVLGSLMVRADEWEPPPPPPHVDLRRPDAADLREFVKKAVGLPFRLRQVAALCLEAGLTLDECAAEMGVARGTVRVHLRRLRAIRRECLERERLRR